MASWLKNIGCKMESLWQVPHARRAARAATLPSRCVARARTRAKPVVKHYAAQTALHRKLAALESAEAAAVTASGMVAISTSLLTVLAPGDHLLAHACLSGRTHDFIAQDLAAYGIAFDFIDTDDPGAWARQLRPNTKAIYVETMANPLLQVADLGEIAILARANGCVSLIDNTFASPVNFRPAEWGYDLSLHRCTKYLNGHSGTLAGAVIGRAHLVEPVKDRLDRLGGALDPHAAALLYRGIKTLAARVKHQNESAFKIARFLEAHPALSRVHYPGLESHKWHHRARQLLDGFGGMISFELKGGVEAAERFMRRTKTAICASSLGGVKTLMTRPAITSHSGMSCEHRLRLGISDHLIRLAVGIEATAGLIEDFDRALAA